MRKDLDSQERSVKKEKKVQDKYHCVLIHIIEYYIYACYFEPQQ